MQPLNSVSQGFQEKMFSGTTQTSAQLMLPINGNLSNTIRTSRSLFKTSCTTAVRNLTRQPWMQSGGIHSSPCRFQNEHLSRPVMTLPTNHRPHNSRNRQLLPRSVGMQLNFRKSNYRENIHRPMNRMRLT